MSGFEVAGVVLGSLPLVLAALEHYAEGIATAKRFWKYKSEMRSLILQINTERGIFVNTLEQLLTGIVRVEHMTEFLARPGGDAWKGSEADLKLRLRSAYQIYIDNVRGMERTLRKMMEKLALGEDGKPQFSDPSAFKQEYRRLKFSISKSEYAELLSNLRNYNQALTRLTKQSLELESSRAEGKSRCPDFKAFQSYARSLYDTLRSGWRCNCQGHAVNLRLEHRKHKTEREEDLLEQAPFRVIFSYASDQPSTSRWPSWKEAEIRCIADKPISNLPAATSSAQNVPLVSNPRRRVRFEQIELHLQQASIITTTATGSSQSLTSAPTPDQIEDLCKAIARLRQPHRDLCIGYLLDGLNQWKHRIYPLERPIDHQQQWAAYSLKDVLARTTDVHRRLTQHDKLRVAVDLSSSILQLWRTPWLDEQWGKEDVLFIYRPGASIYEHPFVCRKFSPQRPPIHTSSTTQQRVACRVIRNQTLFTLGILLIELWYGKSIEELQTTSDLDCAGTPGATWCTADRLVENEIEFEAGKRYSDAVRRCIRCDFDRKDMSLDNESFQHAVYDGVVALLENTLHQFNSLD